MANQTRIKLLRSTTAGNVPLDSDLEYGELALNLTDKRVYAKDSANNVYIVSQGFDDINNLANGAILVMEKATVEAAETNLPNTDSISVDSFDASTYRSAKYFIQGSQGTNYQAIEVILLHNDSAVYLSEYGEVFNNTRVFTVDGSIGGGSVSLDITAAVSNTDITFTKQMVLA